MTTSSRKCGRLAIFATFSHRYEDQNHLLKDGILLGEWYSLHLLTKLFSWVQRKISSSDIFLVIDTTFWRKRMIDIPGPTFSNAICVWCPLCKTLQKLFHQISTMEIRSRFTNANFVYGNLTSQREFMMPYLNSRSKFQYTMWKKKMVHYCCPMYTPSQINTS